MLKKFKTYYRFLLRRPVRFTAFQLVLLISAALAGFQPYFYKLFVGVLPTADYQQILRVLLLFVGVKVATNLTSTLSYYLGDLVLIPAAKEARLTVFNQVQNLDLAYHTQKSTGALISAFKRGDSAFFDLFHNLNLHLTRIIVGFAVMTFFFSRLGAWVVWPLLAITAVAGFAIYFLVKFNMSKRRRLNREEDQVSAVITDNLINYETVKYFAQEERERQRLKTNLNKWQRALWRFSNSFRYMDLTIGFISNLGIFLILFLALQRTTYSGFGADNFILVLGFLNAFFPRLYELFFNLRNISRRYVDLSKYFAVLEEEPMVADPADSVELNKVAGEIVFDQVSFTYPHGKDALENFNITIEPGESVALVGESGAGKTTVVKLLLRFYDVDEGAITIDGVPVERFDKEYLRSLIGVVPQEPILFNESLGFNIAYGDKSVTQQEVDRATELANLAGFIDSLPGGYDTPVGERGVNLSGGQKQRLAIARMIIADPKIIVFDEATSQLDARSEQLIQQSFWQVQEGRSTIIIAHRLSTVRRADRIVVIEDGRVVEQGKHDELLKMSDGHYRRFWRMQTRQDKI